MSKVLAACFSALASLTCGTPSFAQKAWTSPHGEFTLQIPDGWNVISLDDARVGSDSAVELVIGPGVENKTPMKSGCTVMRSIRPTTSEVTQSELNCSVAKWDKDFMIAQRSKGPIKISRVLEFSNRMESNVQSVSMSYVLDTEPNKTVFWNSQFYIAQKEKNIAVFSVACLAPDDERGNEYQRAQHAFKSLTFLEQKVAAASNPSFNGTPCGAR